SFGARRSTERRSMTNSMHSRVGPRHTANCFGSSALTGTSLATTQRPSSWRKAFPCSERSACATKATRASVPLGRNCAKADCISSGDSCRRYSTNSGDSAIKLVHRQKGDGFNYGVPTACRDESVSRRDTTFPDWHPRSSLLRERRFCVVNCLLVQVPSNECFVAAFTREAGAQPLFCAVEYVFRI